MRFFETFQELVNSLPLTNDAGTAPRIVIASLQVPEIAAGDVVDLDAFLHVTNDLPYTMGVAPYLVRAASPTATEQVKVVKPAGENITRDTHHKRYVIRGIDGRPPAGTWYYNLVAYAYSTAAKAGARVTVENKVWLAAKVLR